MDERKPGATFAPGDLCWIDFETRGRLPITVGTDRYSMNADAILLAWAIGDSPVVVEQVKLLDLRTGVFCLRWAEMPRPLRDFYYRATAGDGVFVAHNATFDRCIWNNSTHGFPLMEPWMMIDTRVQCTASGLPAGLGDAARYVGAEIQKAAIGKTLIKLFCLPNSESTPANDPEAWASFVDYAKDDVGAMRSLFKRTRQLPIAEWKEYWAAEAVNDYGVSIDVPLVKAAAEMAKADKVIANRELAELTDGEVTTVDQVQRMIAWLKDVLPSDAAEILVKREETVDLETGEVLKPEKGSLERDRVQRLIVYLEAQETLSNSLSAALRLLQIRLYGGSKTPAKFGKMLDQNVAGIIRYQYVFGGASQTGRFSAKGIQVHNLMRDSVKYEIDAIDALVGGMRADQFAELGDDTPISRKLSMLIRPSLIPQPGHVFAWGDWSNIEARLTPWLANDEEANERLEIFAAVDRKEEKYDIYVRTAAELMGVDVTTIDDKQRQRGKVVELACGFGGGKNALLSMAASYGMHLEDGEAQAAVDRWRDANPWAQRFWGKHDSQRSYGLWGAVNKALENPGTSFSAGRVSYVYVKDYLGGSLVCLLPSGRYLTYRKIKWETRDVLDDDDKVIGQSYDLMFSRDVGRVKLWPGLVCENIVQAAAADILRGTLVRLGDFLLDWMPVVLHTHDEIVNEVKEDRAEMAAEYLRKTMVQGFEWTAGLPIAAETVLGRWYTKNKGSMGL